jgi:DNA-binding transcriptional ArsR family regulator
VDSRYDEVVAMTDAIAEVQEFLRALASETRQRILFLFVDGQERTVSRVAEDARLGQSTASEHLAVLRRAGLLTARREGKEVYYWPDRARISALLRQLSEMLSSCCRAE